MDVQERNPRDRGSRSKTPGIYVKQRADGRTMYQATVWSARDKKLLRKEFALLKDAKDWRDESKGKVRRRELRPTTTTVREAAEALLAGMRDGSVRTRSGDRYKPSAIRSYEQALNGRQDGKGGLLRDLGAFKLADVTVDDVQAYADRLLAGGAKPSTVRNGIMPLRVIFRLRVREVPVNPTVGLRLPAVRGERDRIASPAEAERLLAALPEADRPLWATALYAGLRRGELMGLRSRDVDVPGGLIQVAQAWDPKERKMVAPKSKAGVRRVPIPKVLKPYLATVKLAAGDSPDRLVFGTTLGPFSASSVAQRADRVWKKAKLDRIGLHECRHTFASLMIAAGVNAKALSTYMGHANISITLDRYGHLMPGNEAEAAGLLDAYLDAARAV